MSLLYADGRVFEGNGLENSRTPLKQSLTFPTMTSNYFFPESQRPGLFRSSAWLSAWNESWSDHQAIKSLSNVASISNLDNEVYLTRSLKRGLIPQTTAFPLGVSVAGVPSVRSEYFFFPASNEAIHDRVENYLNKVLEYNWNQFYLPDILVSSPEYPALLDLARSKDLYVVSANLDNTYGILTTDLLGFDEYLRGLGKNTRLKLFNKRKNLNALGAVSVENIWPDKERFFKLLDNFHEQRWGKPCYRGRNITFIEKLLEKLIEQGHEVDLSVLSMNQTPVSVLLDVRVNGRQYNLQSGYLENYVKNISLGTLHFGYQIETAFSNTRVDFYDFMAGRGKHSDYKKLMATHNDQLASLFLVRSHWLKLFYKIRPLLKRFSKS